MKELHPEALAALLVRLGIPNALLAISGGVDSMVLLDLFQKQTQITFHVAHVNYNIRPASEKDAALVAAYCQAHNITFHQHTIAKSIWKHHKGSVQLKAREQRYSFFEKVQQENQLAILVTAHHRDDATETFFINLLRGTGIKGLSGWQQFRDNRFRPLLPFAKTDLYQYATAHGVPWREDESNAKNQYLRNHIRQEVLPRLFQKDTRAQQGFHRTLVNLQEEKELLATAFEAWQQNHITFEGNHHYRVVATTPLDIRWLKRWIYEPPFGIKATEKQLATSAVGSLFNGSHWQLRKGRQCFFLSKTHKAQPGPLHYTITKDTSAIQKPYLITFETLPIAAWKGPSADCIDLDKDTLRFPLTLRTRQPGDTIQPLGMLGKRKLKKVLSDCKLSHLEKEKTLVLCDTDKAVALLGVIPSELHKVTSSTTKVYRIKTHI